MCSSMEARAKAAKMDRVKSSRRDIMKVSPFSDMNLSRRGNDRLPWSKKTRKPEEPSWPYPSSDARKLKRIGFFQKNIAQ
jgi:hypothetical protein